MAPICNGLTKVKLCHISYKNLSHGFVVLTVDYNVSSLLLEHLKSDLILHVGAPLYAALDDIIRINIICLKPLKVLAFNIKTQNNQMIKASP